MAYRWKIVRAAVEQEISFPCAEVFRAYMERLKSRGEDCQVIKQETLSDGSILAVVRRNYNNNAFFRA